MTNRLPVVLNRDQHTISRKQIQPEALKIMYRLIQAGYTAYLVGGAVRDLLLGKPPKDFDIATDARPDEIRKLFRNSRIIGRRFQLVHVYYHGGLIVEVATFRRVVEKTGDEEVEVEAADNDFGTPEEDAFRRDLTINALFYNPADYSVIDYTGGLQDLGDRVIRMIGDPLSRFREDPVRMLRALRHAARSDFTVHPDTWRAITENAGLINECNASRIRMELMRELVEEHSWKSIGLMRKSGLMAHLLPDFLKSLDRLEQHGKADLYARLLETSNSDVRAHDPKGILALAVVLTPLAAPEFLLDGRQKQVGVKQLEAILGETLVALGMPKWTRPLLAEIYYAQAQLDEACERGVVHKRLRRKQYFHYACAYAHIRYEAFTPDRMKVLDSVVQEARDGIASRSRVAAGAAPRRRRRRRRPMPDHPVVAE